MFTKDNRGDRRMPVDILLNKYIDGEPHVCRAVNISRGGMLLYKVFEPDLDYSDVSLEFQLPGSSRILRVDGITLAEHRWARAHGVRFMRMSDDDQNLLEQFLRGDLAEEAAAL
jgi:PilZ domain-containing protein